MNKIYAFFLLLCTSMHLNAANFLDAIQKNNIQQVEQCIEANHHWQTNSFFEGAKFYSSPLHCAVEKEKFDIVKLLILKHKAEIKDKKLAEKIIILAAQNDNVEIIKNLVASFGIDLKKITNIKNNTTFNLLFIALKPEEENSAKTMRFKIKNNIELIRYLVQQGFDVNEEIKQKEESKSPLIFALTSCSLDTIKFLISEKAKTQDPALMCYASINSDPQVLEYCIKNKIGDIHYTHPLMNASPIGITILLGRMEQTKLLLKHKANIHIQNPESQETLLHMLIQEKNINFPMIQLLLENGIDTTIKDKKGKTALDYTEDITDENQKTFAKRLIQKKGNLEKITQAPSTKEEATFISEIYAENPEKVASKETVATLIKLNPEKADEYKKLSVSRIPNTPTTGSSWTKSRNLALGTIAIAAPLVDFLVFKALEAQKNTKENNKQKDAMKNSATTSKQKEISAWEKLTLKAEAYLTDVKENPHKHIALLVPFGCGLLRILKK